MVVIRFPLGHRILSSPLFGYGLSFSICLATNIFIYVLVSMLLFHLQRQLSSYCTTPSILSFCSKMPPRRNTKRGVSEVPGITEPAALSAGEDSSTELPPRWRVKPEDFKHHVDYSLMNQSAMQPLPKRGLYPRQQRWKNEKREPITDMKDVPEGWNPDELDIDQDDIDGQIERCLERIEDGIMPQIFELKLEMYEERRAALDEMIRSEPDGLSWDVVQRLHQLKIIQEHLNKEGDPDEQLPNVNSLIAAYSGGKLEFKTGTVSYWTKGVQLNPPHEFNEDIHKALSKEHDTSKAWWVEGVS